MTLPPHHTGTSSPTPYEPSVSGEFPAAPSRAPRALRALLVGVGASIVLLIALPVVMLVDQQSLTDAILRATPDLDPRHLDLAILLVMIYSIGLHLLDVILLLWLTPRVLRGRHWARIALTAYLIIATYFSLDSASKGAMFLWAVIPTDILHVLMIGVLWLPPSVRRFFAAHRAHDRARKAATDA